MAFQSQRSLSSPEPASESPESGSRGGNSRLRRKSMEFSSAGFHLMLSRVSWDGWKGGGGGWGLHVFVGAEFVGCFSAGED